MKNMKQNLEFEVPEGCFVSTLLGLNALRPFRCRSKLRSLFEASALLRHITPLLTPDCRKQRLTLG